MNAMFDSKKNGWVWLITLFCLLVGMLLAAALKTQQNVHISAGIDSTHLPTVVQELLDQKEANNTLRKTIGGLRAENARIVDGISKGDSDSAKLGKELQNAKRLAGLVAMSGEGVEVTLKDSQHRLPPDTDSTLLSEYVIHDVDIRRVVNELVANGAEAVSIKDQTNNQRVVSRTAIRCVGAVIQVNRVDMTPPYTVCAVGPKDILENALKMPGGMIETFRFIPGLGSKMIGIRKYDNIVIPAYSEDSRFKYAAPEKNEGTDQ